MKQKINASDLFDTYYQNMYKERWPTLRNALVQTVSHVAYKEKLEKTYFLDGASVESANALPLDNADTILDMCAAPGGKSLVLASRMKDDAQLISNEFSRERKKRLHAVLDEHLPSNIRSRVIITGRDASLWSKYEKEAYDAILLDAPCSSERHVLNSPTHLAQWSPARIRNISFRQWALISGAWLVLKKGGFLLYSTCALSTDENDTIITKLQKKYSDCLVITHQKESLYGEKTEHGYHLLPDTSFGLGPIYYALMEKVR